MPTIRVGVQANSTSSGQSVDIDAGSASVSLLSNLSAEGVQYSTNAGGAWTTVAAGASAAVGSVTADGFRVRRQNAGGYPLAVDVTFSPADVSITGTPADQAAFQAMMSGAGISGAQPVLLVGDSNTAFSWDSGPTCAGIVDNGDGTGTISFGASSHNWYVGSRISVNNSVNQRLNAFDAPVVAVTTSNPYSVTYQLGGRTSPVVSGAAAPTGSLYMGRYSPNGYAGWLEALRGRRLSYILAAAGGADSTQALTLYNDALSESLAAKCGDVVLMIGTNDVFARGWSFETARTNVQALVDRIRATTPARLWWVMPIPMGSGAAAWSAGKQTVMNRLIRWMWRYATQVGATPIDSWRGKQNGTTFVNAGAANPDPTANFLGADATHTSNLGALALANTISAEWDKVQADPFGQGFQGGHAAVQNQGNALANSRLTGTGGTKTLGPGPGVITGTVPDSWTVEVVTGTGTLTLTSPARTVAADGDADGNNLQVIPSVSANTWRLVNTTSLHTAVTAGEVRDAYIPLTITGAAGLTAIEFVLFGANSTLGNTNLGFTGISQAISGDLSLCLRIPRWVVPSGLTSLSFFIRFTGATAGTFLIGKPCLELVE
jgi:lysophospholipase L1-like esterase